MTFRLLVRARINVSVRTEPGFESEIQPVSGNVGFTRGREKRPHPITPGLRVRFEGPPTVSNAMATLSTRVIAGEKDACCPGNRTKRRFRSRSVCVWQDLDSS